MIGFEGPYSRRSNINETQWCHFVNVADVEFTASWVDFTLRPMRKEGFVPISLSIWQWSIKVLITVNQWSLTTEIPSQWIHDLYAAKCKSLTILAECQKCSPNDKSTMNQITQFRARITWPRAKKVVVAGLGDHVQRDDFLASKEKKRKKINILQLLHGRV